jgi:hypothetical protein
VGGGVGGVWGVWGGGGGGGGDWGGRGDNIFYTFIWFNIADFTYFINTR